MSRGLYVWKKILKKKKIIVIIIIKDNLFWLTWSIDRSKLNLSLE